MKKIEDSFKLEEIQRVFVHELGHFLAEEINKKENKGTGGESITLFPCLENSSALCGYLTVFNPDNIAKDVNVPKERLPYFNGKLIMGCIFQSYLLKTNLERCFQTNGKNDSSQRGKALNIISVPTIRLISDLEDKLFVKLKENKTLQFVTELNPLEYILWPINSLNWYVDLDKVMNEINSGKLKEFEADYLEFVKKIEKLIIEDKIV